MLKIIDGQICCLVELDPCLSGSVVYAKQTSVGDIGSVVEYAGGCYTVEDTESCGTPVTGPFTSYETCEDCENALTGVCPECPYTPTSFVISGLQGTIGNCGGPFPALTQACNTFCNPGDPLNASWGGEMVTTCGVSELVCTPCVYMDTIGTMYTQAPTLTLSDGTCILVMSSYLYCVVDGENDPRGATAFTGWVLQVTVIGCGSGDGPGEVSLFYIKSSLGSVIGGYSFDSMTGVPSCSGTGTITPPGGVTLS